MSPARPGPVRGLFSTSRAIHDTCCLYVFLAPFVEPTSFAPSRVIASLMMDPPDCSRNISFVFNAFLPFSFKSYPCRSWWLGSTDDAWPTRQPKQTLFTFRVQYLFPLFLHLQNCTKFHFTPIQSLKNRPKSSLQPMKCVVPRSILIFIYVFKSFPWFAFLKAFLWSV